MPKSKIAKYIKQHGLTLSSVAQKAGITRQALAKYGETFSPTMNTLRKVAAAMTALDVPTKVTDLVEVLYKNDTPESKTAED